MVDVSETPAVPPMDPGGDERIGYRVAGGLLIFLGWGLGVVVNLLLHLTAPTGGRAIGPWVVFHSLGPYAEATIGLGLFTGAIGVALLVLAQSEPKGPLVMPGYPY